VLFGIFFPNEKKCKKKLCFYLKLDTILMSKIEGVHN